MKTIKRICAVLVGMVLLVAGLLKLMDPVGAGLVAAEYLKFLRLDFLSSASSFFGVAMALLEAVLGAALITGVWPVLMAVASGLLLGGFTILTLVLWIADPPMDCGCFGEAVHLTHLQTLLKNVVLCTLWAVAFIPFKSVRKPLKIKYVSFGIAVLSVILFTIWSIVGIPAIDFTSYKPGTMLMQAQETPSKDSPLLSFCDAEGEYCDEMLGKGSWMVVSVFDREDLSEADEADISELCGAYACASVRPVVLLSDGCFEGQESYTSDRRTLMTLNRSNGGATLISAGTVIAKWPRRSYPSPDAVQALLEHDPAEAVMQENAPKRMKLQGFLLYLFAVLLLL
ncbi:MAG: hypothetical protein J5640_02825 [Bacteroidales bacterium]|nr:hypothetical protein [Bacteroidales bacterium]